MPSASSSMLHPYFFGLALDAGRSREDGWSPREISSRERERGRETTKRSIIIRGGSGAEDCQLHRGGNKDRLFDISSSHNDEATTSMSQLWFQHFFALNVRLNLDMKSVSNAVLLAGYNLICCYGCLHKAFCRLFTRKICVA